MQFLQLTPAPYYLLQANHIGWVQFFCPLFQSIFQNLVNRFLQSLLQFFLCVRLKLRIKNGRRPALLLGILKGIHNPGRIQLSPLLLLIKHAGNPFVKGNRKVLRRYMTADLPEIYGIGDHPGQQKLLGGIASVLLLLFA